MGGIVGESSGKCLFLLTFSFYYNQEYSKKQVLWIPRRAFPDFLFRGRKRRNHLIEW